MQQNKETTFWLKCNLPQAKKTSIILSDITNIFMASELTPAEIVKRYGAKAGKPIDNSEWVSKVARANAESHVISDEELKAELSKK